jgi:hypothetical protein
LAGAVGDLAAADPLEPAPGPRRAARRRGRPPPLGRTAGRCPACSPPLAGQDSGSRAQPIRSGGLHAGSHEADRRRSVWSMVGHGPCDPDRLRRRARISAGRPSLGWSPRSG